MASTGHMCQHWSYVLLLGFSREPGIGCLYVRSVYGYLHVPKQCSLCSLAGFAFYLLVMLFLGACYEPTILLFTNARLHHRFLPRLTTGTAARIDMLVGVHELTRAFVVSHHKQAQHRQAKQQEIRGQLGQREQMLRRQREQQEITGHEQGLHRRRTEQQEATGQLGQREQTLRRQREQQELQWTELQETGLKEHEQVQQGIELAKHSQRSLDLDPGLAREGNLSTNIYVQICLREYKGFTKGVTGSHNCLSKNSLTHL